MLLVSFILCSCSPASTLIPLPSATPLPASATPIPPTATSMPTATGTATITPTPTTVPTQTVTPVEKLRVTIIINMAVCHYAPGKPYLYKYGVYKGYNMEAISRDVTNTYVEVQAIGGDKPNPCWVNAEYMEFQGDMNTLKVVRPEEIVLPMSPYYAPPVGIKTERSGDEVTVIWFPLNLKAGDSSEQTPYIIEAWVCQAGELVFQPVGSYQNKVTILDEAGCEQPSSARLLAAEKHGYTRPVGIDWPPQK
ncbi:MAG: hypothetical protein AB9891_01270 [Anaerolineaceae bacterium]